MTFVRTFLVSGATLLALVPLAAGADTYCADIPANLTLGGSSANVSKLQEYLIRSGFLEPGSNTGYYGFLTAQAVGRAQVSLGVLTSTSDSAYGIVGPKTRAALACGASSSARASSSATSDSSSAPNCTLTIDKPSIAVGRDATISWTTTNARIAVLDGGIGNVSSRGSYTIAPLRTATYTLAVESASGAKKNCTATIAVSGSSSASTNASSSSSAPTCSLNASKPSITIGQTATLSWSSTNASIGVIDGNVGSVSASGSTTVAPIRTTTYTYAVQSASGQSTYCTASISVSAASSAATSAAAPTCSLSSNKSSIHIGETATLSWSSSNATLGVIDENVGSVSASGSTTVAPIRTTTYTYAVQGSGGSKYCTAKINVSAASAASLSACTNATAYRTEGGSHSCSCSGNFSVTGVWGSGPYTDDSNICAAALHAGVIGSSGGNVTYTMFGANDSYTSSSRNGVTTNSYGAWNWSYSLSRGPSAAASFPSLAAALEAITGFFGSIESIFGGN